VCSAAAGATATSACLSRLPCCSSLMCEDTCELPPSCTAFATSDAGACCSAGLLSLMAGKSAGCEVAVLSSAAATADDCAAADADVVGTDWRFSPPLSCACWSSGYCVCAPVSSTHCTASAGPSAAVVAADSATWQVTDGSWLSGTLTASGKAPAGADELEACGRSAAASCPDGALLAFNPTPAAGSAGAVATIVLERSDGLLPAIATS
jgi:hypothetical protein